VPTYQYACKDCGHAFDQFQSFSDDALSVCPVCEGRLRKVFNAVGVVFKGSGFYRNDSRAAQTGSDVPAASSAESGGSSDGKTSSNGSTPAAGSSDKPASTSPAAAPASSPAGSKTGSKTGGAPKTSGSSSAA
jgi:putative FmdB family regulatory protein